MAGREFRVQVVGLRELRKDLRGLEDEAKWRPALRQAGFGAASIVATEAKRTAARGQTIQSGKHAYMGSKALGTIRALAGQTKAQVAGGSAGTPWYRGWEFGGAPKYRQFPGKRKSGYNLYPAISAKRDEVIAYYTKAIDTITRDAFPE